MSELLVLSHDDVKRLLPMENCIELMAEALTDLARGESWQPLRFVVRPPDEQSLMGLMPAHHSSPRAAYGLKTVCIFPGNPARGLPVVMGMICVSSAETGEPLALVDVRAVTALRTGAVAAVAAQELAREDASSVGMIGCGLHGAWAARCLAAAEFGPGVCFDVDPEAAGALAGELGWEAGAREDALACDIVTCVTPGHEPDTFDAVFVPSRPGYWICRIEAWSDPISTWRHAVEAKLEGPVRAFLLEVRVVVDHPRHHGSTPEVDAAG